MTGDIRQTTDTDDRRQWNIVIEKTLATIS